MGNTESTARKEGKEIVRKQLAAAAAKRKEHEARVRKARALGVPPPPPPRLPQKRTRMW